MNFLVIRFSSLGDVIQTTAFLDTLKKKFPESKITYATKEEFGELLKGQPYIDRLLLLKKNESLIDFAKRVGHMDCVFDLHSSLRSILLSFLVKRKCTKRVKKHVMFRRALVYHSSLLKDIFRRDTIDNIEDQIKLIDEKANTDNIKPIIYLNGVKKRENVIGMAPGARWKTKMWPKEYYKTLANILTEKGFEVFLFGSKDEVEIADFIRSDNKMVHSFVGKLSLKETAQKMAECSCFVSNDSGLMHLAVAIDLPVVAIFGPTVKGFGFYPRGRSLVLESDIKCRPCSLHGTNKCKRNDLLCLYSIKPETVFESLMGLLND